MTSESKFYAELFLSAVVLLAIGFGLGFWAGRDKAEPKVVEVPVYVTMEPAPTPTPAPTPEPTATPEPVEVVPAVDPEALEMLALVIYQEAGGDACSDDTRQMVGEVVLNRVADDRFPDTLYEVLTQKSQYGRLHWTGLVWPERAQNSGEAHAVQRAYDTAEALLTGAVERLLPEDTIFQAEFPQGVETVAEQDGLYFCR